MSRDPMTRVGAYTQTPQSQPLRGEAGKRQHKNAAGGYVFTKDTWRRVEDFAILGTSGGTYYLGTDEQKLATENAGEVFTAAAEDGPRLEGLVKDIATSRPPRAPKPSPYLFTLAAARAHGDTETRQLVAADFSQIVRTTDHLAKFIGYSKQLNGKDLPGGGTSLITGRSLRRALASWFTDPDVDAVAWKALKARQRKTPQGEALALRDVLRIAHPKADGVRAILVGWLAGTVTDEVARNAVPNIDAFLRAQDVTTTAQAVKVVNRGVPWEFLPPNVLGEAAVWSELVHTVGYTALVRNLAKMTRIGTLKPFNVATATAVARLTDPDLILASRIHPAELFLALKVYASGRSQPSDKKPATTWEPVTGIMGALEEAWEISLGGITPTGKRLLLAIDSSGSMTYPMSMSGSDMGSRFSVANALALTLLRTEPNAHVINVDTRHHPSQLTRGSGLAYAMSLEPSGGGTDMAVPLRWAKSAGFTVDGVVILTDTETWAGRSHPQEELDRYRRTMNPDTRAITVAMESSGGALYDYYAARNKPQEGVLDVAGLDASLPQLVNAFIR
jgi:60 kDa SS-A/Ro ribonucleoprotein